MRRILKSKVFWGGALVGTIAGQWALNTVRSVTGVGVRLPKA